LTIVLFEFVYGLKQAIYTQLVVICGQQNYKLDTKHAIARVIEEGTRECDVRGSIRSNRIVHKKLRVTSTETEVGWVGREASLMKNACSIHFFFSGFRIKKRIYTQLDP
jgi:hypothetical protein